jgi:hypothetical protein
LLGPSAAGFEDFRELLGGLSLGFPDRRVVLMVYLSGLGDRAAEELSGFFPFDETFCTGGRRLVLESPFLLVLPATEASEDGRGGIGGLRFAGFWGTAGRDSSEYVTAGIVPCPIDPLKLGPESGVSMVLVSFPELGVSAGGGTMTFSCRDTRKASSKSMRSLHCSSNSFRASISAFSVSVRDAYSGRALFAL